MDGRPDPEQILKKNFPKGSGNGHGRLKIFFGYAAGVGKTYAMLEAARDEAAVGRDVLAGYIEPHDRPETMALLSGLEVLPPRWIKYRGIELREFDLDGVLMRRPGLVLVDELAHTNVEGCRHRKRWQDVIELLEAGIDVYTTVNVQHLESLHDIVASITHVRVSERIPDRVFDQADQVELVDIYRKEQAGRAAANFFTVENLSALREIALRRTADRVNREVVREREAAGKDYYTGEHVLVCLSPSPTNARVIRTAARMAGAFRGDFTAILVETSQIKQENAKISKKMEANIALAKQFGANVITLYGEDIVEQIAGYARRNGISKIVIGRTVQKPHLFYVKPTLIDRLIKRLPNMDIYVIPDSNAGPQSRKREFLEIFRVKSKSDFLKTALILGAATLLSALLYRLRAGEINVVMVYIMGVVWVAYATGGRRWGVTASLASVVLFNFFFTEPRFTFQADAASYPFTFGAMLFCALVTSTLAGRLKQQAGIAERDSRYMQVLLNVSRSLRKGRSAEEVLEICGKQVKSLLGRNIVVYGTADGKLSGRRIFALEGQEESAAQTFFGSDEEAVAVWAFKNRHKAGRTTDTLPGAKARYTPVYRGKSTYAVIGVELKGDDTIPPNDKNVLNTIAAEAAARLTELAGE